jgi:hypothetical protein
MSRSPSNRRSPEAGSSTAGEKLSGWTPSTSGVPSAEGGELGVPVVEGRPLGEGLPLVGDPLGEKDGDEKGVPP